VLLHIVFTTMPEKKGKFVGQHTYTGGTSDKYVQRLARRCRRREEGEEEPFDRSV
jgi:hypothetical protein